MIESIVLPPLITEFFPRGVSHYAIGGIFIGLGVVVIYLGTGLIPGASTFLESTLSYVSSQERFQEGRFLESRDWRIVFTVGIIAGAAIYALIFQDGIWTTEVQAWRLFAGGILIGVGTRLGKGCTSGHGVCGVGSRSGTSIINVVIFMAIAIGVAQIIMAMGVQP